MIKTLKSATYYNNEFISCYITTLGTYTIFTIQNSLDSFTTDNENVQQAVQMFVSFDSWKNSSSADYYHNTLKLFLDKAKSSIPNWCHKALLIYYNKLLNGHISELKKPIETIENISNLASGFIDSIITAIKTGGVAILLLLIALIYSKFK